MSQFEYSASADRVLRRAGGLRPFVDCDALAVLLAILDEDESPGARRLELAGITKWEVQKHWGLILPLPVSSHTQDHRLDFTAPIAIAIAHSVQENELPEVTTDHVLTALFSTETETSKFLQSHGLSSQLQDADDQAVQAFTQRWNGAPNGEHRGAANKRLDSWDASEGSEPLGDVIEVQHFFDDAEMEECFTATFDEQDQPIQTQSAAISFPDEARTENRSNTNDANVLHGGPPGLLRVLDAALNRAAEGLRVLEDYARFILNSPSATRAIKQLRHEFYLAERGVPLANRLAARNTPQDVGAPLTSDSERQRNSIGDVARANAARCQQALRSLEEFGKLLEPSWSALFKALRYRLYEVENQLFASANETARRVASAKLYVLMPACENELVFERTAAAILEGGAEIIQLRAKNVEDRCVVARGQILANLARNYGALAIVNDRPDLAMESEAHGVHVGQEETSVETCRRILGPQGVVGLSTHSHLQIELSNDRDLDYIGVGPVFPSTTKRFERLAGLNLVQAAATLAKRPAFAIGGITLENLLEVLATGIHGVAVGHAITGADDPRQAAARFKEIIKRVGGPNVDR